MPENGIKVGRSGVFGKFLLGLPCTVVYNCIAPGRNEQELKLSLDPDCGCELWLPLSEGEAHTSCSLVLRYQMHGTGSGETLVAEASLQSANGVALR